MNRTSGFPNPLIGLLCGAWVVGITAFPLESAASRVQLIETGEFHGDEVRARTGERWLGLYVSRTESALIPTTVRVKQVHDAIVDEDPGEKTGKRVMVRRHPAPIFLLSGAGAVEPGHVTTVHRAKATLENHSDVQLRLARMAYHLRVVTRSRSREGIADDARLVLATGKSRQVLYSLVGKKNDEGEWNLLWAGDLDHDGKLDLYVEVSWHYNLSQRKLFLSSAARRGRLVREVAEFSTEGC